ncbi:MAG: OPT/YSL family transporter [Candidatus Bathyarchaeota archaeon]|nr:OPT/YSL family transporter [Candidatus Bathyarchaeota archaeon]
MNEGLPKSKEKYIKGLTWRSGLALIFSIFIIQPIMIYFNLISNATLPLQVWITILLWTELSRLLGSKLTKGELFILLTFQSMATWYALSFLNPIRNMYNSMSEPAIILGIRKHVPEWWAPREDSLREILKSSFVFFHPAWIKILSIMLTSIFLTLCMDLILGYFLYALLVRVERLPFPAAMAQAQTILTLSERPPDKMRALLLSSLFGVIYNLLAKFLPFMLGSLLYGGMVAYTFALPVIDLTYLFDYILPGASLSFVTDIIFYVSGLLLPLSIAVAQFIGAFGFYFVGTHLITRFNLWPAESQWVTGWDYFRLVERSLLYFYVSVAIGLSIAALIIPIMLNPKPIIRAFAMLKSSSKEAGKGRVLSIYSLLGMYFIAALGLVFLVWLLTDFLFPIWILLLTILGGSFFATYLAAVSLGITFTGFPNIPYLREMAIFFSGYEKRDVWFAPFSISTGGISVVQNLLQADICEVKHKEYFSTYILVVILGLFSSFIFVTLFWSISPIPSSAYPATITSWPVDALTWSRTQIWIWSGYLFRPSWILLGFILGSIIHSFSHLVLHAPYLLISMLTGLFIGIAYSPIGIYTPYSSPIGISFAQLIGSLISNKMFSKILRDRWLVYRPLVVMGIFIGDGFMELLRAIIVLIVRSSWLLPY